MADTDQYYTRSWVHVGADGKRRPAETYSRDGASIHHVTVIEGMQFASIDAGPMSNFISDWGRCTTPSPRTSTYRSISAWRRLRPATGSGAPALNGGLK